MAVFLMVRFDSLSLSLSQFHWVLYVDILCLCDDGNLLDSACLAATAALKTSMSNSLLQCHETAFSSKISSPDTFFPNIK